MHLRKVFLIQISDVFSIFRNASFFYISDRIAVHISILPPQKFIFIRIDTVLKRCDNSGEIDIHIRVYQRNTDIITFGIDANDNKIFRSADCLFSLRHHSIFWIKFHPEDASDPDLRFFQHFNFTQQHQSSALSISNESAKYDNTSSLAPFSLAIFRSSILRLAEL